MIAVSYDAGINFFDNAEVYADGESEIIMGDALQKVRLGEGHLLCFKQSFWEVLKPTQEGTFKESMLKKHAIKL